MSGPAPETKRVRLTREEGFRFRVRFDRVTMPDLLTDESPPIGKGEGPTPARLLAAAVGNCLAASLVYCLEKARLPLDGLEAEVTVEMTRNAAGRLRIGRLGVRLSPSWTPEVAEKAQRCLAIFEDFCLVTQAVRHGVPIEVSVEGRSFARPPNA